MAENKFLNETGLRKLIERIKNLNLDSLNSAKSYTDEKVAANKITVDASLSGTSTNPVQNKTLKSKFDSIDNSVNNKIKMHIWESGD